MKRYFFLLLAGIIWISNSVMFQRIVLTLVLCSVAGIFPLFSQENILIDSLLLHNRDKVTPSLLFDSLKPQPNRLEITIPQFEMQKNESFLQQKTRNSFELNTNDSITYPLLILHPKFKPFLFFKLGASKWTMPVIGDVTTFSPTLNYQVTKALNVYGGISFSQFHNLSYVQSIIAPNWPVKSNIISNGFVGVNYRLNERIILHGIYQRSIYNQLPANMMMFAPGQNVVVAGVSFDAWNGLGATVDHVWEFDDYGNYRKGFRISPYIDISKFLKFLGN